jgi:2-oxoisovalerate dehydrogenase E2 component (dihydrolipoyl transacylase)
MSEYVFKLPDLGEGTVESEIGEWFIKVGDDVAEETVVATMMTDKAAVELSSPITGKVIALAGEPGDIVAVGAPLVTFASSANGAATSVEETPVEAVAAEPVAVAPTPETPQTITTNCASETSGKVVTSPAVRRIAREVGIDLSKVEGSGANGRILRSDLEQFLTGSHRPMSQPAATPSANTDREVKIIGLRRMIAERMTASKREIPHYSYVEEIDITELETLRKHLNAKRSERLTVLPFISLALIRALHDFPQCNATYDKDRNVVVQHGSVNLGIATQTPDGLKVPVIHNADTLSLDGLSFEIKRVADAAKNNTAKKNELSGSTITVTSLGKLGGIVTTPVINMPEVGIIGVNRAVERPVVVNGQVAVRTMMNLSSSFDHRFVDGYDAAAMIQSVKEMLEHPATIFIA